MLFKGTKTCPANAIAQKIQDVGGYINAYTSFDRTVFWIDVPKDGVATALDVLSDAMMNSTLAAGGIRQGTGSDPTRICHEHGRSRSDGGATSFRDRVSAASLPAAGDRSDRRFSISSRGSGDASITRRVTSRTISRSSSSAMSMRRKSVSSSTTFFNDYPEKSLQPVYIPAGTSAARAPRSARGISDGTDATLAHLAYSGDHPSRCSRARFALAIILGDGRSSRLYRRVREEAGLAFGVSAFSYTPGDPGLLGIDATVEPEKREAAQELVLQIVDEIKQAGVTADEVDQGQEDLA